MFARLMGLRTITPAELSQHPSGGGPLVFYCSNPLCRKAPNAARRAKGMGYTDVRVMSAGIRGWLAAGLPTSAA